MNKKQIIAAFTSALACLAAAGTAHAVGPAGLAGEARHLPSHIVVKAPTLAPYAFVRFCIQNASDCAASDGPATASVDAAAMRQLQSLNREINRDILPEYDMDGDDVWQADVTAGDCEDFALTKRRRLLEMGWPANALRMAIAYTPNNNGHAVLVVSTSRGDLVLDNRTNAVRNWHDTDLRWVMIQSAVNPLSWNQI
ncbi:MAG: transglutaminase-like cysteine peptidase [Neorhizobium sp.]|jgi:predicted transglutaminase-like cysteine proteinase|nr:transglutaminase-like cysteine peptidase [Neorhizobium sp.]